MSLTNSLRRARKRSGVSLRSVAARSGVGASNLSAIENGRRDPTSSTVDRLSSVIGIEWVPVVTQGRASAARALEDIAHAEAEGQFAQAYRRFIQLANDLASADAVTRVLLSAEKPEDVPSRWVDAVAALLEVRLREVSAPVPWWVLEQGGHPDALWEPQRGARPIALTADLDQVLPEFIRRGVAIEQGELVSV